MSNTTSPWIVESGKKYSGENWLVCSVGRSTEDDLEYYVTTDHVHASELSGDAKYDARLIAAAPELLEGLRHQIYRNHNYSETCDACRRSIQAVRKAEGEL